MCRHGYYRFNLCAMIRNLILKYRIKMKTTRNLLKTILYVIKTIFKRCKATTRSPQSSSLLYVLLNVPICSLHLNLIRTSFMIAPLNVRRVRKTVFLCSRAEGARRSIDQPRDEVLWLISSSLALTSSALSAGKRKVWEQASWFDSVIRGEGVRRLLLLSSDKSAPFCLHNGLDENSSFVIMLTCFIEAHTEG